MQNTHTWLIDLKRLTRLTDVQLSNYSQSGHRLRGIRPCTPWPAGFWCDISSAASPSRRVPPRRLAAGELSEPGRSQQVDRTRTALHCPPDWSEFALSCWTCRARLTHFTRRCVCVRSVGHLQTLNPRRHDWELASVWLPVTSPVRNWLWLLFSCDWSGHFFFFSGRLCRSRTQRSLSKTTHVLPIR